MEKKLNHINISRFDISQFVHFVICFDNFTFLILFLFGEYWLRYPTTLSNESLGSFKSSIIFAGSFKCDNISFCYVLGEQKAILPQNLFPVTKEYIGNILKMHKGGSK